MSDELRHELMPRLAELRAFSSTPDLLASPAFRVLEPEIRRVLSAAVTYDDAGPPASSATRPFCRAVAWNIERGLRLDEVMDTLSTHPILRDADLYFLTELDFGMARTQNRDVPGEIARHLGVNGVFVPCYLNLDKGSGLENHTLADNDYGIHGNALFSRWPMRDAIGVPLPNGKDKMRGQEKRIGSQTVAVATVDLPGGPIRCASLHLDAHSSPGHRRRQMGVVLDATAELPSLVGGDWNTSTHDTSRAVWAILGFWLRVLMGPRHCLRNHYPYPDRLFERRLFEMLEGRAFDYRSLNQPGACTVRHSIHDPAIRSNLNDWLPNWCIRRIDWALRPFGGEYGLKLDWFAGRAVRPSRQAGALRPAVIQGLAARGSRLSDHDPIVLDFEFTRTSHQDGQVSVASPLPS